MIRCTRRLRPLARTALVVLASTMRRRGRDLMSPLTNSSVELLGYSVPVHRALTEPILLGGAPGSIAILNGTLAAALGLGLRLWLVGVALGAMGHFAAVWAARRDPMFVEVTRRHLRISSHLSV